MPDARVRVLLDAAPLDGAVLADLSRVEVRESDADPGVAILRFKVKQDPNGRVLPIDDERFEPYVPLAVDLGAPGGAAVRLFDGFVTFVRPHFETIESNCYVEVVGMDAAAVMDANDRAASWPDHTDSDVARALFDRYGLQPEVTDTDELHAADRYLLVQRESDWRFLQRLARRNGFRVWIAADDAGTTGYFGPRPVDAEPQADLILLQPGENLKWLDIQWRSAGAVAHAGAAIDPVAKKLVRTPDEGALDLLGEEAPADAVDERLGGLGGDTATGWLRDPPATETGIAAAGRGAIDDDRFVLEARGELDPTLYRGLLRARRPVLVRGVGRRFAGTWYVRSVRTTYVEGKVAQTFVAERNALGLVGDEPFGGSAEEEGPQ